MIGLPSALALDARWARCHPEAHSTYRSQRFRGDTMDQGPSQTSLRSDAQTSPRKAAPIDQSAAANANVGPGPTVEIGRRIQLGGIASDREILLHGRRAFAAGKDDQALESLRRLVAHGVRYADVHYMIGMIQERRGEIDGALAELRESIRINPSYVEALLALASLHERRGEFDRSQGYAERASQLSRPSAAGLDPTTRGKLANQQAALADAFVEAGERRDAIAQYRGALERCPTFHDIRHRLAITLREAGLPAQALQEFQRILRLQPSLLDSQVQLGLTYYSMGRTPEAVKEWDSVLEKDPSRDEARMYLRLVGGAGREAPAPSNRGPLKTGADAEEDLSFSGVTTSMPSEVTIPRPPRQDTPKDPAQPAGGWKTTELSGGRDE